MMEELFNLDKYLVRTAILAILALVSGIFITHKIIGPIFRIKKAFREISEGNYDVYINLRPGDEFFDMGKEINELAAALKRLDSSSDSKKKSS